MKFLSTVTLFLFMVACSTFSNIDEGVSSLRGQNINSLISIIGLPSAEQNIAGRKIYVWDTSQTVSTTTAVPTYNPSGFSTYAYVPSSAQYVCTIKVVVDENDIIQSHELEGNIGGCERWSRRISSALG